MSLEDNIRALERAPMLGDIGRDALRLLAFSAEMVNVRRGDRLFEKGSPAEGAFAVVSGRLLLSAGEGRDREVGPGTLVGEMALLVPTQRPCDAVAVVPARLLSIPRPLFRRMLDEFPEIAGLLRDRLAQRVLAEQAALERVRNTLDSLNGRKD